MMKLLFGLWSVLLDLTMFHSQALMQNRIIGGNAAAPNSIRYMVSLQSTSGQHFCGGSLVHRYWVLTAAHCNIGTDQMMIVAGDYKLNVFEGTEQYAKPHKLIPHPLYNSSTNNADIMLIKVQHKIKISLDPFNFFFLDFFLSHLIKLFFFSVQLRAPMVLNKFVSLAPLPRQGTGVVEGHPCQVSGWGHNGVGGVQAPVTLQSVTVPIVSAARCNSSDSFDGNITANMICAGSHSGGKDACKGDSGGPLVCRGRVYGMVSWGYGCGDARFPGVYTAVSRFRRWLDQTIYGPHLRCFGYR
uniref:trypsin n=1 Tax=Cyprinodon variegatus TaxID=28743 RepID=A0A3Q2GD40_CYPVA